MSSQGPGTALVVHAFDREPVARSFKSFVPFRAFNREPTVRSWGRLPAARIGDLIHRLSVFWSDRINRIDRIFRRWRMELDAGRSEADLSAGSVAEIPRQRECLMLDLKVQDQL